MKKVKHFATINNKRPNYSWSKDFNICCSPEFAFGVEPKKEKKKKK